MKRILNGKTYNTETAKFICEERCYSNGNWSLSRDLYKTNKGVYFFAVQFNRNDIWAGKDRIELSTEKEAKMFCEEHGNPDEYIAEWGEPDEA